MNVRSPEEYPYKQALGKCQTNPEATKMPVKYAEVEVDNEDHLAYLLDMNGPVIVYICAGSRQVKLNTLIHH